MFIGHFAPAFVAASIGPRAPKLGTAFFAAQLLDWAFFALAIVGVEKMRIEPGATVMVPFDLHFYPYTHSLLGAAIWAIGFALLIIMTQRKVLAAILSGLVVLSHWGLDWVAHRPDLPLGFEGGYVGLGLWNHPAIAMPLEIAITMGAFLFYLKRTRGPVGQPVLLFIALIGLQVFNWFGPEPSEVSLFFYAQALIAFAILTALAAWVGENRQFLRRGGLAAPST